MLSRLQKSLQWCFVKVEGLFNLAFGDKLNPLYYIGPISYYLMWLVVASGLYLYVFFETSVTGASASVDALTQVQPWAGGVLRSVHRYASDGMVLTMLLHMTRHWAFDRYRGFRWFSWLSGVMLLWLVYVAGINGYMLPWDRLAKFTVVATAEWLDWLPVFNGTLVRNFIFEENVNDRLFSLLSFIHIGVPLAILALLWVHTQRVPQARTSPPLPIAVTLTVSLIVLSLIKPAVSQHGAGDAPLGFDWFYLPVLALVSRWDAGEVWLLVGGASALLFALPWLPPRRRALAHHMLVRPDNRIVAVRGGETLLDAALREGIALRFDCRAGGCGECKATLRAGTVDCGAIQPGVLSAAERSAGVILPCVCTPREDVELEYVPTAATDTARRQQWSASVESMRRLAPDVMQVILRLDPGERIAFYAGQYINILLDDGEKRSFSFATAPSVNDRIELHVRRIPDGRYTAHVFEAMRPGERVRFEGPLGSFLLREDSTKPMIFVAGATGFAPVKSMLEYAFSRGLKRRIFLYWGVRSAEDMYLRELPERWAREHENFTFVPVIGGLVHEAILKDFPNLAGYQVYACGSAGMVQAAHPAFTAHGLGPDDCFSDAFLTRPELARLGGTA